MSDKKKKVTIIAIYCRDFSETDNGRFMYLATLLSKYYDVELLTSAFDHDTKAVKPAITNKNLTFKVTYLPEPGYTKNVSPGRMYSHYCWGKAVYAYLNANPAPDIIYSAVPTISEPIMTGRYCKKHHIPLVLDILDLWPEAFQMVLKVPVVSDLLFLPYRLLADHAYRKADAVCSVSKTYIQRARRVNHKKMPTATIFIGTELKDFDRYASGEPVLKKEEGEVWLGYCGSLSTSYDIKCVIDALAMCKHKIKFVVMGDGPQREEFEQYAQQKKVDAVFTGRLTYDQMCSQLCECDMTVNPITQGSAASIINKHGDYAASGLPVINTQESPEYRALVDDYEMGFNCNNGDAADMAARLDQLAGDPELRLFMGRNARKCAEENFERKVTYKRALRIINYLLKKKA